MIQRESTINQVPTTQQPPSQQTGPHAAPKTDTLEFDPKLLLSTIRHCWYWATPLGIAIGSAVAFSIYVSFVPMFRASYMLEANQDYIVFRDVLSESSNLEATERQIILSDIVMDDVVGKPELQSAGFTDPIKSKDLIKDELRIRNAGTRTLLQISFGDPDPQVAALVCNAVATSFLEQRERLDTRRVSDLEGWLTPSIDQWKAEVQGHESRIAELSKSSLGFDPNNPVESLEFDLGTLSKIRKEVQELRVQESWKEAKMINWENPSAAEGTKGSKLIIPEPTTTEINRYVENNTDVTRQRSLLAEQEGIMRSLKKNGLVALRQDYFAQVEVKVENHKQDLEEARKIARESAPEHIKDNLREVAERARLIATEQAVVQTEQDKLNAKNELAQLKVRRALLEVEYDRERERVERKGGNAVELMFAQEDRAIAAELLGTMRQRLAAIKIERRRGSGLQTVAAAKPPTRAEVPLPLKNMVLAGLMGLVAPFALGLLLELQGKRISKSNFSTDVNLVPFGEVATLPSRVGQSKKQRVFEESIDTLRANLMLSKNTRSARTVTVASSMSGEGKSSVSSQLAISLAKACGETVLLIDADLRSPDQHDIFGLEMGLGLAGVMAGECELADAVDETLGDLVHVLPAGRMSQSPHRLLSAPATRALLDQALEKYRYVVIDTAPVLSAGETLAVASETDATLICVMRDVSRSDAVLRTSSRLEAAGANIAGTVFSGVPSRQYAYRYGDYRYLTPKIGS